MAYVEIKHLVKRFGPITAVDDVTFSVERGEVLGFLGPNGAGKSTTMKMITGFLAPDAGTIAVGGAEVSGAPIEVKRRLGYLPEGAPLYGDMTPMRLLEFVAEVRGLRGEERDRRIRETIERVNLGSVVEQSIETLSKGFKRRVGLAQAILHDPDVLVLDEPTDGLDPNQKHEVRALIRSMAPDKVIILSTHILEEVEAVCSRAIIIARGKVVSDGTPGELEARSVLHNAVTVTLTRDAALQSDEVRAALSGITGAAAVELLEPGEDGGDGEEHVRLRVLAAGGQPIITDVSQLLRERGWSVEELHVERGRLDEVFRSITLGPRPS